MLNVPARAVHDLGMLGIKHSPTCIMQGPGNKHIGTNTLQVSLLRTALLLGGRGLSNSATAFDPPICFGAGLVLYSEAQTLHNACSNVKHK